MSKVEQYEVLVLGSGTGGKLLSWALAREGKKLPLSSGSSSADRVPTKRHADGGRIRYSRGRWTYAKHQRNRARQSGN